MAKTSVKERQVTLILAHPQTNPKKEIKTYSWFPDRVFLDSDEIALADFLVAALYVLTNNDLVGDDPRKAFVEIVKKLKLIDGYDPKNQRYDYNDDATPDLFQPYYSLKSI